MGILDAMDVETACPGCGRRLTLNVGQAHRTRRTTCCGCGQVITLKFTGDDLGKIDRAYRDLEGQVRSLGGSIRIKKQ